MKTYTRLFYSSWISGIYKTLKKYLIYGIIYPIGYILILYRVITMHEDVNDYMAGTYVYQSSYKDEFIKTDDPYEVLEKDAMYGSSVLSNVVRQNRPDLAHEFAKNISYEYTGYTDMLGQPFHDNSIYLGQNLSAFSLMNSSKLANVELADLSSVNFMEMVEEYDTPFLNFKRPISLYPDNILLSNSVKTDDITHDLSGYNIKLDDKYFGIDFENYKQDENNPDIEIGETSAFLNISDGFERPVIYITQNEKNLKDVGSFSDYDVNAGEYTRYLGQIVNGPIYDEVIDKTKELLGNCLKTYRKFDMSLDNRVGLPVKAIKSRLNVNYEDTIFNEEDISEYLAGGDEDFEDVEYSIYDGDTYIYDMTGGGDIVSTTDPYDVLKKDAIYGSKLLERVCRDDEAFAETLARDIGKKHFSFKHEFKETISDNPYLCEGARFLNEALPMFKKSGVTLNDIAAASFMVKNKYGDYEQTCSTYPRDIILSDGPGADDITSVEGGAGVFALGSNAFEGTLSNLLHTYNNGQTEFEVSNKYNHRVIAHEPRMTLIVPETDEKPYVVVSRVEEDLDVAAEHPFDEDEGVYERKLHEFNSGAVYETVLYSVKHALREFNKVVDKYGIKNMGEYSNVGQSKNCYDKIDDRLKELSGKDNLASYSSKPFDYSAGF